MRHQPIVWLLPLVMATGCAPGAEPLPAPARPSGLEEIIERVETGLQPPVVIGGEEQERYTLADRMAFYDVPGVSIAVIHESKLSWAQGYGMADVESGRAVSEHTMFQAASISKPVAAVGAMRMVRDGRLALERPVNELLASWQVPASGVAGGAESVDLEGLLSHSAGLTVGYVAGAPLPSVVQILDGLPPANTEAVRIEQPPGSAWRYSGGGYTVLQLLMTDVSGDPFPALMDELVLGPIGMADSTYEQPLLTRLHGAAACGYQADGSAVTGHFHVYPEMAAAGLWTTPSDLARFAMEIQKAAQGRSRALIHRETALSMLRRGLGDWGLGFKVTGARGERRFEHGGSNAGFKSRLVAYRDQGLGAVVMTNGDRGAKLIEEIFLSIAEAYEWPGYGPTVRQVATVGLDVFVEMSGSYELADDGGLVRVTVESGGLFLEAPAIPKTRLYPYAENLYFFREREDDVRFAWEEETPARAVTIGDRTATRVPSEPGEPSPGEVPAADIDDG